MRASVEAITLADARSEVERACGLLCAPSPGALDRCAAHLQAAVAKLEADNLRPPSPPGGLSWAFLPSAHSDPVRREALSLRSAVCRAGRLLRSAADYHETWRRTAGALCAGYTGRGEAGAALGPTRLSLRG